MMSNAWNLFVLSLPGRTPALRMRTWRGFKARGAAALRDGVYLLPWSQDTANELESQAETIIEAGGSAHVMRFEASGERQQDEFKALFDRRAEYHEWFDSAAALLSGVGDLDEPAARRGEAQLRRDLAAITAIDFFADDARREAEGVMSEVEQAINARYSPGEPSDTRGRVERVEPEQYRKRHWATRQSLWIDRVASAWLIKHFIDPDAQFTWLARPADCPRDAVGFDFDGAEFTHVGQRVTFEVLLACFGLEDDPALAKIAALVHHLDVGGLPVVEAAGVLAVLEGARRRNPDDDAFLASASTLFDDLHAAYGANRHNKA